MVLDAPEPALIGAPFYEDFEVLVMTMAEMAAEKLRTLAQRSKVTELAGLAVMLRREEVSDEEASDEDIARLALDKFTLVRQGVANREARIEQRPRSMGADYGAIVPSLFPEGLAAELPRGRRDRVASNPPAHPVARCWRPWAAPAPRAKHPLSSHQGVRCQPGRAAVTSDATSHPACRA